MAKRKVLLLNKETFTLDIKEMNYDAQNNTYSLTEKDAIGNKNNMFFSLKEGSDDIYQGAFTINKNSVVLPETENNFKIIDFDSTFVKGEKETTLTNEISKNTNVQSLIETAIFVATGGRLKDSSLEGLKNFLTDHAKAEAMDKKTNKSFLADDRESTSHIHGLFDEGLAKSLGQFEKINLKNVPDERFTQIAYEVFQGNNGTSNGLYKEIAIANKILDARDEGKFLFYKDAKAKVDFESEVMDKYSNYFDTECKAEIEKKTTKNQFEVAWKNSADRTRSNVMIATSGIGAVASGAVGVVVATVIASAFPPAVASIAVVAGAIVGIAGAIEFGAKIISKLVTKHRLYKQVENSKRQEYEALKQEFKNLELNNKGELKGLLNDINKLDADVNNLKGKSNTEINGKRSEFGDRFNSIQERISKLTNIAPAKDSKDLPHYNLDVMANKLDFLGSNSKAMGELSNAYKTMNADYFSVFGSDKVEIIEKEAPKGKPVEIVEQTVDDKPEKENETQSKDENPTDSTSENQNKKGDDVDSNKKDDTNKPQDKPVDEHVEPAKPVEQKPTTEKPVDKPTDSTETKPTTEKPVEPTPSEKPSVEFTCNEAMTKYNNISKDIEKYFNNPSSSAEKAGFISENTKFNNAEVSRKFSPYSALTKEHGAGHKMADAVKQFLATESVTSYTNAYKESQTHESFSPDKDTRIISSGVSSCLEVNSPDGTKSGEVISSLLGRSTTVFSNGNAIEINNIPTSKDSFYTNGTVEGLSKYCENNNIDKSADILLGVKALDTFFNTTVDTKTETITNKKTGEIKEVEINIPMFDAGVPMFTKDGEINEEYFSKLENAFGNIEIDKTDGISKEEQNKIDLIDLLSKLKEAEVLPEDLVDRFEGALDLDANDVEKQGNEAEQNNNGTESQNPQEAKSEDDNPTTESKEEAYNAGENNLENLLGDGNVVGHRVEYPEDFDADDGAESN